METNEAIKGPCLSKKKMLRITDFFTIYSSTLFPWAMYFIGIPQCYNLKSCGFLEQSKSEIVNSRCRGQYKLMAWLHKDKEYGHFYLKACIFPDFTKLIKFCQVFQHIRKPWFYSCGYLYTIILKVLWECISHSDYPLSICLLCGSNPHMLSLSILPCNEVQRLYLYWIIK